jgi:hypothetical protein
MDSTHPTKNAYVKLKKWTSVRPWVAAFPAAALPAVARYDAAVTPFGATGARVVVFGGLRAGVYPRPLFSST